MRPCCHCLLITQIAIEYAKRSKAQHEKRMRNEVERSRMLTQFVEYILPAVEQLLKL